MKPTLLVDTKVSDLADDFLDDVEIDDEAQRKRMAAELAALIQTTIEDQLSQWESDESTRP